MASASTGCLVSGNVARAEVSAQAGYGALQTHVTALAGPLITPTPTRASGAALASYTDMLTIVGTGSGFIRVRLLYSMGTIDASGDADFTLGPYTAPTQFPSVIGSPDISATVPIQFGTMIPITARLREQGVGDGIQVTITDFRFSQLFEILNESGNKLTGYQYISSSDGAYAFDGGTRIAIPEPASATLFLTGMAMSMYEFVRRYRKFRS